MKQCFCNLNVIILNILLHIMFTSYLAILNIPQKCWANAIKIVPVAIIIAIPMQHAAVICSTIKEKYFCWSIKYSVIICMCNGRDSLIGKTMSRIFVQYWLTIRTVIAKIPITKSIKKKMLFIGLLQNFLK